MEQNQPSKLGAAGVPYSAQECRLDLPWSTLAGIVAPTALVDSHKNIFLVILGQDRINAHQLEQLTAKQVPLLQA